VPSSRLTPRAWSSTERLLFLLTAAGCSSETPAADVPRRTCSITVWHQAASDAAQVEIVSSWTQWKRPGVLLPVTRQDGWRVTSFDLAPGENEYGIVDDGLWLTDPNVGTTAFHDGHEVTWVLTPDCSVPALRVDSASASSVAATFLASSTGPALDPASVSVTGLSPDALIVDASKGSIAMTVSGLPTGKHVFFVHARDTAGHDAEPARGSIWVEPREWDWRDAVIYQVMVDRFRASPPASPSGWAGGNVDGVRSAIESGEIPGMGFNTVWLSPLYLNPDGEFPGPDGRSYSGYHGYWPKDSRTLDPRFATDASLTALVEAAHAKGIRIIFDVVPHHVHQEHSYVTSHPDGSWFTDWGGGCVCGADNCSWAGHTQDCWFASYLPTLDWTRADVADQVTGDVTWWLDRYDADGLRIDAVPMMPRAATRRIAAAVRARFDHTYLLGENFTGAGGYESLRYELGPFGLDGEFHFPLMWALRGAIAWGSASLVDVDTAIHTGEQDWKGSGSVMAVMIGNHDVTRFSSESAGDAGGDGWVPAQQSADPLVYAKQRLALGILYSMEGAPVVYYGDEIGLAGRADPDSRRVMPPESALTPDMVATRDFVTKMAKLRACSDALRRGDYRTLVATPDQLVFARDTAIVVASRTAAPVPLPAGSWVDALTKAQVAAGFTTKPWSLMVLLPAGDPCLQ
jgi:glycosidase